MSNTRRYAVLLSVLAIAVLAGSPADGRPATAAQQVKEVAVIAPSVSTSMEANRILAQTGYRRVGLRKAAAVLVVVRSALYDPLSYSYSSYCELVQDAESQLNIAGMNFHVYVYALDDDLVPSRLGHQSYPAG